MNALLQNLLLLQSLESGETTDKNTKTRATELRAQIPVPILAHYDRLSVRGKKGVAIVRNQVCTGCHMRVPIGVISSILHGQDIQLCGNCGRYLCLPEEEGTEFLHRATVSKPAPKLRQSEVRSHAA